MYDSSADENPFSKFAWQVYLPSMPPDTYENDWIDWIASLNDAAKDLPSAELRQLHQDLLFVSHARNLNVVEHDKERPELFIHDRQIQGLTMDWKRARQLYRKMQEE